MSKNKLIQGTIVLTIAGILTRIIGFFYRIFLSNAMGAELLGIYQLIFPVYGVCFTIFASGLQTAISRMVAAYSGKKQLKELKHILLLSIGISISLALGLSIIVYSSAGFIATRLINEPRCIGSLRILSYVFPFAGVTSCINGYYYGLKKTSVPASTQLIEQIVRVIFVYILVGVLGDGNIKVTCEMACLGLIIGEVASNIYNILSLFMAKTPKSMIQTTKATVNPSKNKHILKELSSLAVPLTANRLLVSLLHSFEAVLIPIMFRKYGLSVAESLSLFGILNGMAMPFILFPSAITNALAVLLLPTISEAQALGNDKMIGRSTSLAIKYSLIIGIFSTGVFVLFGNHLGTLIYHNATAGTYIRLLALLCPFLYVTTTLGSVINGLGKAHITFINSVIGTIVRIVMIVVLMPTTGFWGFLVSSLTSQLLITILDGRAILKETHFTLDSTNSLLKPFIIIAFTGMIFLKVFEYLAKATAINQVVTLLCCCCLLTLVFTGFLFMFHAISKQDF